MKLSRKVEKKELQKFWKCRKSGERFVYFIFDGLTLFTFYFYSLYQIHFILFNRVYLSEWEIIRTSLSVDTKNREIMSFIAHLIAPRRHGSITVFNPITGNAAYTYIGLYTLANCLKMKNLLEKNSNICQTLYAFQKSFFFSRFKIYILIYQRYLVFLLGIIKFT